MSKSNLTAWERWELASLDDGTTPSRPPLHSQAQAKAKAEETPPPAEIHIPTAAEVEQIHQQARDSGYQEGFEEGRRSGHEAGYAAGHEEGKALGEEAAQQLLAVAARLDESLQALDGEVTAELTALVLEVAREVLRQTLLVQPETVVGVVRDALSQLPHQHASIYLHPDDVALVRSYAGDQLSHAGHRIHEDVRLQRNDVTIEAAGTHIDATLATRWRRVVETLGQDIPWDGKSLPAAPPPPAAASEEVPIAAAGEPSAEAIIAAISDDAPPPPAPTAAPDAAAPAAENPQP